jgi:glycosyltransferase involved in cell wall biosynthesis
MEQPLVSICTPCYNHEKYIKDYLYSIIKQDYTNIELIICDDNSSDQSYKILEEHRELLEERFSRVIILKNINNLGITKNCNLVTMLAKGKYIKLFASDDIMLPNCISESVYVMEHNNEIGVLIGGAYIVPDEYKYGAPYKKYSKTNIITRELLEKKNLLWNLLFKGNFICAPTVMIRKNVYYNNGYYDESTKFEDYEFWLRISKNTIFYYYNRYNVCYRQSITSVSNLNIENRSKNFLDTWYTHVYVMKKYLKFFDNTQQKALIANKYNYILLLSLEYKLYKQAWRIYKVMKKKKIKVEVSIFNNIFKFIKS